MSVFSLDVVGGVAQGNVRTWAYNLINQTLSVTQSGGTGNETYAFDALGRTTSEAQPNGSVAWQYDAAGDPTRLTWADGFYVTYAYDMIGGVTAIGENGATSGIGLLASYSYDNLGRRTSVAYGNGTSRNYAYDAVSRLAGLQLTFPNATGYNQLIGQVGGSGTPISYTPSSQIASITRSNDAYAWTGSYNVNRAYTTNGLNQYSASGGVALGYDPKGNLTSSGSSAYTYNFSNLLTTATGAVGNLYYDNIDRLSSYTTASATALPYYAGPALVAETNGSAVTNRYVPGPGTDEPIVWYQGSGTSSRNFLQADERGSIIAVSNSAGAILNINAYDEFGIPASTNSAYLPRYAYTGQTWYPEIGLYNYKARFYSPTLGRFMQTDPIGYGDGLNIYNYVHSDPVNRSDSTGLDESCPDPAGESCGGAYVDATNISASAGSIFNQPCGGDPTCSVIIINGNPDPAGGYPATTTADGNGIIVTADHNCSYYGTCDFVSTILSSSTSVQDFPYIQQTPQISSTRQSSPTPQNGSTTRTSVDCSGAEDAKELVSITLDAAGAIPGEGTVAGLAQLGVASASIVNSAVQGDLPGGAAGGAGYVLTTASFGNLGAKAALAVPVLGNLISAGFLIRDAAKLGSRLYQCY